MNRKKLKTKTMKTLITLLLFTGLCYGQLETFKSPSPVLVGEYKTFGGLMAKLELIDDRAYFTYRDGNYQSVQNFESFYFSKDDMEQMHKLFFSDDLEIGETTTVPLEDDSVLTFTKLKMMGKKYVSVGHYSYGVTRTLPYMKEKHINKLFGK